MLLILAHICVLPVTIYIYTYLHTYIPPSPCISLDQDQMARDLDAAVEEMVKEGWDEEVARNVSSS